MKICVISPAFYPAIVYGGPIFSIYRASAELAKLGVDVFVATTNANGKKKLDVTPNVPIPLADHFIVKYYDDTVIGRFSWKFVLTVWRDIRDCDLVRLEDLFSTYIPPALFFSYIFRKPVLISPRGVLSKWALQSKKALAKKIWLNVLIKPFLRNSWWHATSEQEKGDILFHYPTAKVVVIPNGIDAESFSDVSRLARSDYLRKFSGIDSHSRHVIVSMGRLHKVKGFDCLLNSFAELLLDFSDAKLLIAGGDGGEKLNLESQISDLGLAGKAFLVGNLAGGDKEGFLAGADMFVMASSSENFGNVYLEAMAAGLPIVATKGTPWEQIERVGCGKWVECSVDAVRSAMHEILAGDPKSMGRLAEEYAQQYDWSNIAKEFEAVFAMMLGLLPPKNR